MLVLTADYSSTSLSELQCVTLLLLQLYLLKKYLKMSSSGKPLSANLLGSGLSHAFLKAMVCLLGKFLSSVLCCCCLDYRNSVRSENCCHKAATVNYFSGRLVIKVDDYFVD